MGIIGFFGTALALGAPRGSFMHRGGKSLSITLCYGVSAPVADFLHAERQGCVASVDWEKQPFDDIDGSVDFLAVAEIGAGADQVDQCDFGMHAWGVPHS